jgi:hypothetical protein
MDVIMDAIKPEEEAHTFNFQEESIWRAFVGGINRKSRGWCTQINQPGLVFGRIPANGHKEKATQATNDVNPNP